MRRQVLLRHIAALLFANLSLFSLVNAQVTGQQLSLAKDPTYKSNQSQVVWYQGAWWGVFRRGGSGTEWRVFKYSGGSWSSNVSTDITGGDAVDVHVDESTGKLYVLASSSDVLSRLSYSAGDFTLDSGFPVGVNIDPNPAASDDDPACITQALDGDLFIFWASASPANLMGLHSTDLGENWTSFTITGTGASSSLTDAISFQYSGGNHVAVVVGEGKGEFTFWRLADGLSPTNSNNWVEESMPSISGTADDHVNIVKDASNNLYIIGKNGDENDFFLFKRLNNGSWENSYQIQPTFGTRPALVIDETYDKLVVLATVQRASDSATKIQYTVLDKNNLNDVIGDGFWTPVLESGSFNFNNVTVSYQILDNTTDIMVCASSGAQVWYNVLISDDALPVFMAFFNATGDGDRIKLNWATHSEVANLEWIVYRREGTEGPFEEITRLPGAGNTNTITDYHYTDTNVNAKITYYYRLANVDFDGTIHYYSQVVSSAVASPVTALALYPNYPNPFNNQTTIHFEIGEQANTVVDIFDISGRHVRRLVEGELMPGSYNYGWNGRDERNNEISSGIYVLTFSSGNYFRAITLVLSR